jgi:transposase
VYDLDKSRVVWIGDGKGSETINKFFETCLTPRKRSNIHFASCDMSRAYIGAIKQWCPNARLVLDRFHIVKSLNNAVDEVRKQQWRELKGSNAGDAVKGLRWLLFRHSSTRTPEQTKVLKQLKASNRRIWRAWVLKDEFEHFWDYVNVHAARAFVKRWTTTVLKSRLKPMREFVITLRDHLEDIITFIQTRLTNAVGEGVNRVIRMVKNRASGFYDLNAFADLIYLTVGDLNIPAQIPREFRTL